MEPDSTRWIVEPADGSGRPLRMARLGRGLKNMDRDFDVAFWQAQSTEARMQAAWELVEHYLLQKGRSDELRLQRSVAVLRRGRRQDRADVAALRRKRRKA